MTEAAASSSVGIHLTIEGVVQGVGFRPFLFRLAQQHSVCGWVRNTSRGVEASLHGEPAAVDRMLRDIGDRKPVPAELVSVDVVPAVAETMRGFRIEESIDTEGRTRIPADAAPCSECLAEMTDSSNRRYRYPFTTCTECGPRFSIAAGIRFDRGLTSMDAFAMCADCRREYESPQDRRFHAQTIACPACGPQLIGIDANGRQFSGYAAVRAAVDAIGSGKIVAIKGVGGYQWVCDAAAERAVARLREIKHRPEKPFALMVPDLATARTICRLDEVEEQSLLSAAAPIVLAAQRSRVDVRTLNAAAVPGPFGVTPRIAAAVSGPFDITPRIASDVSGQFALHGVMLPASPLHVLVTSELGRPIVATSANRDGEPMIVDDASAEALLSGETDFLLAHDRRIVHRVDDPVVRVIAGRATVLRNGRGFAPTYLRAPPEGSSAMLALGGHLKNSFAMSSPTCVMLSQHIGDLDSVAATEFLADEIRASQRMFRQAPDVVIRDAHPDYGTSAVWDGPAVAVQHHEAHVLSCAFEHGFEGSALGIAWDGMGFGDDGTLWGGEAFALDTERRTLERVGTFLPFAILGGDRAAREPWRCALAVAFELFGENYAVELEQRGLAPSLGPHSGRESEWLRLALTQNGRLRTSSVGRLFDALCSFLDLRQSCSFEGQGAMRVEGLADGVDDRDSDWPEKADIEFVPDARLKSIDWRRPMRLWLDELASGASAAGIALRFHRYLAASIGALADATGQRTLILSGGVFQNRLLTELVCEAESRKGREVLCHRRIPPNDGGLAVGQLARELYRIGA